MNDATTNQPGPSQATTNKCSSAVVHDMTASPETSVNDTTATPGTSKTFHDIRPLPKSTSDKPALKRRTKMMMILTSSSVIEELKSRKKPLTAKLSKKPTAKFSKTKAVKRKLNFPKQKRAKKRTRDF